MQPLSFNWKSSAFHMKWVEVARNADAKPLYGTLVACHSSNFYTVSTCGRSVALYLHSLPIKTCTLIMLFFLPKMVGLKVSRVFLIVSKSDLWVYFLYVSHYLGCAVWIYAFGTTHA